MTDDRRRPRGGLRILTAASAVALGAAAALPPMPALADSATGPAQVAQGGLPDAIDDRLTQAAGLEADGFLAAVRREMAANPNRVSAIADRAAALRPRLGGEVRALAANPPAGPAPEAGGAAGASGGGGGVAGALGGLVVLGGAGAAAVALGGGGGGGDDAAPPAAEPPPATVPPSTFETAEYAAGNGLAAINAANAYSRGATGSGITVAVVDSGLDTTHPEFAGRIAPGGFDYVAFSPTMEDQHGHGTHVSGTIAAARNGVGMHGVAYDSRILPLRILDENNETTAFSGADSTIADVYRRAVANGARVVNNSWGSSLQVTDVSTAAVLAALGQQIAAYRDSVAAGVVSVWAAGNDGASQPSLRSGMPIHAPDLTPLWLAVVAVDPDDRSIAGFSNRCGVAASWCVAAPGVGIVSTIPTDLLPTGYASLSGTSMAAPHVAGAVAVLLDLFPNLTPQQVVEILKTTATDLGAAGVDVVYGHGLIDLERATRPIGTATVALPGDGAAVPLEGSGLTGGTAFGDGLARSLAGTTLVFTDGYDRAFSVDLGAFTGAAGDRFDAVAALPGFGRPAPEPMVVSERTTVSLYHADAAAAADGAAPDGFALTTRVGRIDAGIGHGAPPALALRPAEPAGAAPVTAGDVPVAEAMVRPFLSFAAQDSLTTRLAWDAAGGRIAVGSLVGAAALPTEPGEAEETVGTLIAATVDWTRPIGERAAVTLGLGALSESETVLGSRGEGALALGGAETVFAGASVAAEIGFGLTAHAGWQTGLTRAHGADGSLVDGGDGIRADGWTVGLTGRDGWVDGDRFGLAVSQPLRVAEGALGLAVPATVAADGTVGHRSVEAELTPSGREIDLQAWYARPLGPQADLALGAAWRTEPGHAADAADEVVGMARLSVRF